MRVLVEETHNGPGVIKLMVSGSDQEAVEKCVADYLQTYPAMGYDTYFRPLKKLVGTYMRSGTRNSS